MNNNRTLYSYLPAKRRICFWLLLLLALLPASSYAQDAVQPTTLSTPTKTATTLEPADSTGVHKQDVVAVDLAEYSAELNGQDLTSGAFTLDVVRKEAGIGTLDWTDIRIAVANLKWSQQPLLAGTSPANRMLIYTDRDQDTLTGNWSAAGTLINQQSVFDLVFPPALNSRVTIRSASDIVLTASHGVLKKGSQDEQGKVEWTLELGNKPATTLTATPGTFSKGSVPARYELETEFRARRDGMFIKADFAIEGPISSTHPFLLNVPAELDVQSVTLFSGASQIGTTLSFKRDPSQPDQLLVPLNVDRLEPRFILRLRAFQSVAWGQPHALEAVSISSAFATRKSVVIRIEPPLQLQFSESQGLLQTSLTSEEATGEVWRYEVSDPSSALKVTIDFPQSPVVADITCLMDARRLSAWTAASITMHVENGSRFESAIQLPDDWKLVSVAAGDSESRIASWKVEQKTLIVNWQNPMTSTSHRQLRLFAKVSPWKLQTPTRLQIPQVLSTSEVSVLFQILTPVSSELQIIESEGWRVIENTPIASPILRLREVTDRITTANSITCTTLKSNHVNRGGRTLINLVSKNPASESGITGRLIDQSPRTESSSDDTTAAALSSGIASVVSMEMLTNVGPTVRHGCMHQVTIDVDPPSNAADLKLRLPENCRLSAISVDGRSITVFRVGDEVPLPSEITTVGKLGITYVTEPIEKWPNQINSIPVPRLSLPVTAFNWKINFPAEQQIENVAVPGVLSSLKNAPSNENQFFGPLNRDDNDKVFNPFSRSEWTQVIDKLHHADDIESLRRSIHLTAPTVGDSVEFTAWNANNVRGYAWVAMMACMLIGAATRLFQIVWIRRISAFWIIILFAAVSVASPPWALILGGMISGSLLSLLIPRRWMQKPDFLAESSTRTVRKRDVATICAILFSSQSAFAQPVPELPEVLVPSFATEESTAAASVLPEYLIASAHYKLEQSNPIPRFRTTFVVFTPNAKKEVSVRLPLRSVVFSPSAECLVNGEKQSLIPSVSGDSIIVRVDPSQAKMEGEGLPDGWGKSEIELEFSIRPTYSDAPVTPMNAMMGERLVQSFHAQIPAIHDSVLSIPDTESARPFKRLGEAVPDGKGGLIIQLGGVQNLKIDPDQPKRIELSGGSAVTLLDVTPLRFKGQTRILPGPDGWPALLPLSFPPNCVITSVTGTNLIDTVDAASSPDSTDLTLRLKPDVAPTAVTINYDLKGSQQNDIDLSVPAFPLWEGRTVPHSIGITGPPTSQLSVVPSTGVSILNPDEWPIQQDSQKTRPYVAVLLNSPQTFQLKWNKLVPVRTAALSEQMTIEGEYISWSASIRLNVAQIPTFRHQFRIPSGVKIDAVISGQDGIDGPVRFSRVGDVLSVFVSGGQLGERMFQIHGKVPLTVDAWSQIPSITGIDTTFTESLLSISDNTGWNIDLETQAGVPLANRIQREDAEGAIELPRAIGTYQSGSGPRPERVRVTMPSRATRAEGILLLKIQSEEEADLISTFHLTAVEASLKKAVFRLPTDLSDIRVRPSLFTHTSTSDANGTTITVKIPDRFSSSATVSIAAKLKGDIIQKLLTHQSSASPPVLFPMVEITSAQKQSQIVLLTKGSSFIPVQSESVRIESTDLPTWIPHEWLHAVQNQELVSYQLVRKELNLIGRSTVDLTGRPVVRLIESVIWPLEKGLMAGTTRVWLATNKSEQFLIPLDKYLHVTAITCDGMSPPAWEISQAGILINLPLENLITLNISWYQLASQGAEAPIQIRGDLAESHMIAIAQSDFWKLNPVGLRPMQKLSVWLERWSALLQCMSDVSGPLDQDSLLLQQIRFSSSMANSIMSSGVSPTKEELELYERNSKTWMKLEEDLAFLRGTESLEITPAASGIPFTEFLVDPDQIIKVDWFKSIPKSDFGEISSELVVPLPWGSLWRELLVLVAVCIVVLYSTWLQRTREAFALRPQWSIMLLGALWWTFLTPSIIGFLIFTTAFLVEVGVRIFAMMNGRVLETQSKAG
ncbi:hypothetical protein SH668x_003192 [Planctomicrobium sp. SH668]|uniref:hypothetical protein n=1 Tax=Planctomicrobium sp. SH668 TaxID=3448126 RepID=UPI003F5B81ED